MPRMMVSRMRVRSLTWVTVRPESRRAFARVAPMLMTHLHRSYRAERPGYGAHLAMPHHRSHRHDRHARGAGITALRRSLPGWYRARASAEHGRRSVLSDT